jgi:phage terminase small subunit
VPTLRNPKQERFAQELAKGTPAYKAYGIAGYVESRTNASALSRKNHISGRVAELMAQREQIHAQSTAKAIQDVSLTKAWVIEHLMENALAALGKRLVRVVKVKAEGETVEKEVTQIDRGAANRALELLGKELMMFIDRHEIGSAGEFAALSDDALAEMLAEKAAQLGLVAPETKH